MESPDGRHGHPDDWEPIDADPASAAGETVSEFLAAEAAALDERADLVDGNVQDILEAMDDLMKLEGEVGSRDSYSAGSSAGSIDEDTPPSGPPTTKKESRFRIRRRLRNARQKLKQSSVKVTRRIVTGNKETRVRDFVVLPKVVRVLDKYTFTAGVLGLLVTEFVLLRFPAYFRYYNFVTMLPLLMLRIVLFHQTKQQYFLLDYCYWVNGLAFVLTILPASILPFHWQTHLWQIFFVSANGPLFFAMIAWNNSLVFHSVDKVTSTYVHLFPALLTWCERWQSPESPTFYNINDSKTHALTWIEHLGYPLLFYSTWQTVYLIQTEWWHAPKLEADPDLSTSLRYLASATKMGINRKTLKLCRSVGIMGPTETFHPPTLKVKAIFVILQMVMTMCTYLPSRVFYAYQWIHTTVVLAILVFCVYNGARYYVQVFSRIYDKRYQSIDGHEEEYVDTSAVMTEHRDGDKKDS